MAHAIQSSTLVDQNPPVRKVPATEKGGRERNSIGFAVGVPASSPGTSVAFIRVPVRARPGVLRMNHTAYTSGAFSVGLYRVEDGVVIKEDALASAVDAGTARDGTVPMNEIAVADRGKDIATLFASEIAAAGAQEEQEVDVCITVTTAIVGSARDVGLDLSFVVPD